MSILRPTLLIFTLGAAGERRRRPLLSEAHGNLERELRHGCLDSLLAAGRATGCRTVVASAHPIPGVFRVEKQGRGSFGSRLRQAMASIEVSTEHPLILVGTDIPDLGTRQIRTTIESLKEHPERVVVGPSPDGGLYLLAASCPLDEILAEVSWQRADTRLHLIKALRSRGFEIVELESLRDLDEPCDLETWLARTPASEIFVSLRRQLHRLISVAKRAPRIEISAPLLPLWVQAQAGRGPPA